MAISCPLCCQSINFDLLRMNLINLRNHSLICPICGDVQHSLDNLAAHLTQQHIELVPSQIGNGHHAIQQCDANNGIQNTTRNSAATICNDNLIEQFKVEPNSNGNMIQKFEVRSPLPPSPPVSSLQNLNIASDPPPSPMPSLPNITATSSSNDQIGQLFVCNLCNGTFRSKELQQMHMQLVHEINIRPLHCESNNNLFANASAISLAPPTATEWQQCYWCLKRFKTIGSLRLHVRMVHGVLHVPQIVCTPNDGVATAFNCETTMSNDDNLMPLSSTAATVAAAGNDEKELTKTGDPLIVSTSIAHDVNSNNLPLIHNNQTDYYSNYGLNDTTFGSCSGNNTNNNDGSGSGSNCDSGMFDQKDTDEPFNGNNNNSKEITTITSGSSSSSTDDRIHKCDICNKRFTTKYFLKKHKRLHTGEMPYSCELCHRTFTFQQSYHRHLSYHTNDRPHSCTICGRAFKELSTLHNHQRIHSGEKPFECETCGKCFRQRVSYLVHQRIHTGAMPYECMTCETKFRYKISLRTHKCTRYMGNERTAATPTTTTATTSQATAAATTTKTAAAAAVIVKTSKTVNDDAVMTFMDNDQPSMSTCQQQSLDELITDSCNRMGIGNDDRIDDSNQTVASSICAKSENGITENDAANQSMLQFDCDSFNLNDLAFCTSVESNSTIDLANVIPSMNEIFPQSIEMLNALYDNANANNNDLQHFYNNNNGSITNPTSITTPPLPPPPPSSSSMQPQPPPQQ